MDDIDKTIEEFEKGSKSTWNGKPTINAKKCQQMVKWLKNYKRLREKNEEEFIRHKLDTINRNSVYGLYAANSGEIASIIHSYIGRDIGSDYDRLNSPKPPIYIGPVKVKTLKERLEETKMKTTSTQTIKNVTDISFSIENDPTELDSKLIIVASTDNDIFEFKFEAKDPLNICKIAKLFAGWEQDQKIRELEEERNLLAKTNDKLKEKIYLKSKEIEELKNELGQWKKELAECLVLRDRAQIELDCIKQEKEVNPCKNCAFNKDDKPCPECHATCKTCPGNCNKSVKEECDNLPESKKIEEAVTFDDVIKICNEYAKAFGKEIVDILNDPFAGTAPKQIKRNSGRYPWKQEKADNVNHPSHYETGKFECIEVMQEVFGITAVCDFCKCNAFKYIYRMDRKNGDEDARKAIWYLNKYLELGEKIDIYKEIGGLIPRPEFVKDDGGTDNGGKTQVPEGE